MGKSLICKIKQKSGDREREWVNHWNKSYSLGLLWHSESVTHTHKSWENNCDTLWRIVNEQKSYSIH